MATNVHNGKQTADPLNPSDLGSEPKTGHGVYQQYITSLVETHPHLQVLERFLDEYDWERWRQDGHPKDAGLTKFNVVVADIELVGDAPARLRTSEVQPSACALETYLRLNPLNSPDSLRLYLVEDLSRDMVEYFGSRFKLDPNFFEYHIRDHERLLSGRSLLEYLFSVHPSAPTVSETWAAGHFTVSFFRPYKFAEGGPTAWKDVQRIRWQTDNVMRHGIAYLKLKTTDAFFLTERFSLVRIPKGRLDAQEPETAIIIFDPFLPLPCPSMMCGYRNGIAPPLFNTFNSPSKKARCGPGTHRALRGDYLDWLRSLSPKTLSDKVKVFRSGAEIAIADHLFKVAAANTQCSIGELQDATEYIENRMHGFWRFKGYDIDEETAADCIQMLRYFTLDHLRVTGDTSSLLKGRFGETHASTGNVLTSPDAEGHPRQGNVLRSSPHAKALSDLQTEFSDLASKLRSLCSPTETDINYFVARLSAKEAHRAQLQADELKWMNNAVFMLGPVSTLAAILSLQERDRNVLVFLLCACVAGLVILLLRFWRSLPRVMRQLWGKIKYQMASRNGRLVKNGVEYSIGEEPLFAYLGKESS